MDSLGSFDDLAGKTIRLELPDDIRDVISCARFLQPFQSPETRFYISAHDSLVRLLSFVGANIVNFDQAENCPDELIVYDMKKLEFADSICTIPYMRIPGDIHAAVIHSLKNRDRVKVAICLERAVDIVDSIMSGFTVNQLMNFDFHIFVKHGQHLEKVLPVQVCHSCHFLDNNIDLIAGIMDQMDIVLAEENVFAHLAGALGKSIWLIAPDHDYDDNGRIRTFINSYKKVCIVNGSEPGYISAIRKVSQYLYFVFSEEFEPFNTNCKELNITDVERIDDIYIDNINSISKILDISVPSLNNIQIETTSIILPEQYRRARTCVYGDGDIL